jgi:hypothetical protein
MSDDALRQQLETAEQEAMEARARYILRNKIVQHVMLVDPVVKAVHAEKATAAER